MPIDACKSGRPRVTGIRPGGVDRHYNEANLLERVEARVRAASEATTFVENVDYNARGQRELVEYGNGTRTEYSYDPETFRLRRMRTVRASDGKALQDLRYITEIRDFAQQDVYFGGDVVSANGRYEYDALYQLVSAAGREQPGQQPTADDPVIGTIPHPNDLNALHRYVEEYQYDQVGNVERMVHKLASGGVGWTRRYEYAEDSNRLLRTSAPGDRGDQLSDVYAHDAHGNMVRVPHLPAMGWDHADRLRHVGKGGGGDVYFTYDAAGERVRKVYVHSGLVEERVYVGGFEVYRKRRGTDLEVERETLHVADGERRVALAETTTVDSARGGGFTVTTRLRYQIDNHLGSSSVETDEAGRVITFEEYFPFGGTSFHSARSGAEVSRKRYRYTGKEKDEETGLYYHGARYYAPWLGRWTAADPAGLVDGVNRYRYARNSPSGYVDADGQQSSSQTASTSDPNDPLNYVTFEDYSKGAVGPWTDKGLRDNWILARPEIDVTGERRIFEVDARTADAQIASITTGQAQEQGSYIRRPSGQLSRTSKRTLDEIANPSLAPAAAREALLQLRADATANGGSFPSGYYVGFGEAVMLRSMALNPSNPDSGVAKANEALGVEVEDAASKAPYHVYESIVGNWDRVQHFVRSASLQYEYGEAATDVLQFSKEFFKDEVPSWVSDDEGWSWQDWSANERGQAFGYSLFKTYHPIRGSLYEGDPGPLSEAIKDEWGRFQNDVRQKVDSLLSEVARCFGPNGLSCWR